MYAYDEEKKRFFFANDLQEYLLDYGVEIEHIKNMQSRVLEQDRDVYQDFPEIDSPERGYITLVPLDKVIGTSRGDVGFSVYENVRSMYRGDREPYRFENCFSYFEKFSLEELKKSYEQLHNPVKMVYYVDDDKYFVSSDGNHRTLTAMLVGAEYIRAEVTNGYCNELKKKKYIYSEAFKSKYNVVKIMSSGNIYDISFKDEYGVYEVCGYLGPTQEENLFSYLERLSKTIDTECKKVDRIIKMPIFVQKIVLHYEKNYRIEQYIQKKYLTQEEQIFWRYRMPVALYDL